jgi:phosphonate transport system substrate-binding protein
MMRKLITLMLSMVFAVSTSVALAAGDPNPDELKVALLPDEDAATILKNNQGFKEYLEKALGKDVELVVTTDYSSMIEAMRFGRIDLAYFGPLSYVLAASKSDISAFAAKSRKGSATYQAVVITNADSGIEKIEDIKGDVAYGDPASTSSHLIPKSMLADKGLVAGEDYEARFLGAHDAVAVAVQNGRAQAGGLSRPIFESLVDRGLIDANKVRVLEYSKPFPQYPWAMRNDLDKDLQERIKQAFYALSDETILKYFKADALAPITDADYDVVRDLKKTLNL